MKKTKIFIIDYNQGFIENLKEEVQMEGEIEIIGSLSDGKNAIEEIDKLLDVDVLIINLVLPNLKIL